MKRKRILSLALILVLLLGVAPVGTPALASGIPSNWAVDEMVEANNAGLLSPSAAKDFHRPLTRDEFCELVVKMVEQTLGKPLPIPATNPFVDDVDPISIHALKAWNYKIITGITTTKFAPESSVERQQICAMMIRAINGMESDLNKILLEPAVETLPFKDAAQIRDYAIEPVKLAYSNGIIIGTDQNEMRPSSDISSQECVAIIIRSFDKIEETRSSGLSYAQLLDIALNRVNIGFAYGDTPKGVTQNITLPTVSTGNSTVVWTSSDSSVISISGGTGTVTSSTSDKTVKLTAEIKLGIEKRTKVFDLTTSQYTGERLLIENAVSALEIIYLNEGDVANSVTGRIGLPTKVLGLPVTWGSNNPSVVSSTGAVSVPTNNDSRTATLTATITLGTQTRTKTFYLTVTSSDYNRGVSLHGVNFGMSQSQVTSLLGTVRRTVTASTNESWQVYYSNTASNFVAVAFIDSKAVAVYSMASNVSGQLKNVDGATITVSQASAYNGIGAVSYKDPGASSQEYAIMIYDTASAVGKPRTLLAEGQEELLLELVNAFRYRNSRSRLEWSSKLATPARAHSNNRGSGNLQSRVTSGGFDLDRYVGGNIVSGGDDAFAGFDKMVNNSTGVSSMRSQILQSSVNLFGAGFFYSTTGTTSTYYTYTLGNVNALTGVSARQNNLSVSSVSVSTGAAATVSVTLVMTPATINETLSISSSNTSRMTISSVSISGNEATLTVRGVSNGNANIVVTGNSSGKSFNVPVVVGTSYASNLALRYTDTNLILSSSSNINGNANMTASRTLIIGTGDTLAIEASTSVGVIVEWTRTAGTAATVAKDANNNNGIITASPSVTGSVTIRARVPTGSTTFITHTINVWVVSASALTVTSNTIHVDGKTTASVTMGNFPTTTGSNTTPTYKWSSSTTVLSRVAPATETTTADFTGEREGTSEVKFIAEWTGSTLNSFLGKVTRTINVTVQGIPHASDFTLSPASPITMKAGDTLDIRVTPIPSTVLSDYTVKWVAADPGCVTIDTDDSSPTTAKINAVKHGSTTITVTLTPGNNQAITKTIEVTVDLPTFEISGSSEVTVEDTAEYSCGKLPGGYSIVWSWNPRPGGGEIDIDDNGLLTALARGSVMLVADLYHDSGSTSLGYKTKLITIVDAPASEAVDE